MPILKITTDFPHAQIPADFLAKTSALVAKLTGKPESYVQVILQPDSLMSFGGKNAESAYLEFGSIGGFGNKTNKMAGELTNLVNSELKISKDRFYIKFSPIDATELSFNGQTFA
ncbi:unnamed protein product [Bursaphelenchus okinawaensis]|uniref:L-dopachrome isomerase n=1 Tax=Bursaphelenchus okinawaensis TaxID=465554 RepID=A0A811JT32_9BILA|nr:unnamed protein product [Bursaphelenchus okinawaensis]CAG9082043.1 unnamed protein product [Bursaphelenchus okinawaensis]